jgi:hypothetical protein
MPVVPTEEKQGIGAPVEPSSTDWLGMFARRVFGPRAKPSIAIPEAFTQRTQTVEQEPPSKAYPGSEEIARSKAVEQSYGSPHAPFFRAGGATLATLPMETAQAGITMGTLPAGERQWVNPDQADRIHAGWLAAERSPVAKMGFSPERTIESMGKGGKAPVLGAYDRFADKVWYDASVPSAVVHESMHRGLRTLEKEGKLPAEIGTNAKHQELVVRALMSRYFGDIEMGFGSQGDRQIKEARLRIPEAHLDLVERAASEYMVAKRPRGPR